MKEIREHRAQRLCTFQPGGRSGATVLALRNWPLPKQLKMPPPASASSSHRWESPVGVTSAQEGLQAGEGTWGPWGCQRPRGGGVEFGSTESLGEDGALDMFEERS